jgi:hypothetical protein
MAKMANIIAIYTKTRNTILEFQSLGNTIDVFLILFPTLRTPENKSALVSPEALNYGCCDYISFISHALTCTMLTNHCMKTPSLLIGTVKS